MLDNIIIKFGAHPWSPRGKYRLYKIIAGMRNRVEGITPDGVRLRFRPDDHNPYFFFRRNYESLLTELIADLPPGGVFVDVGANLGNFSIIAARQMGAEGTVLAFEPVAETYVRLLDHIALNHAHGVVPFNAAIAEKIGVAEMICSENSGLSHLGKPSAGAGTRQLAATIPLDQFVPPFLNGRQVDLLKIDVEGAEFGVLQGACQLLEQRKIKRLHVEIAPAYLARCGSTREGIWEFMEARGYKPRFRNAKSEIYDEVFDQL